MLDTCSQILYSILSLQTWHTGTLMSKMHVSYWTWDQRHEREQDFCFLLWFIPIDPKRFSFSFFPLQKIWRFFFINYSVLSSNTQSSLAYNEFISQLFRSARACSFYKSRSESYSVLSPFLSKLRYEYRRNRQNLFYLLVYFKFESEIAVKSYSVFVCSISKTPYFLLVLQCSKSIIHQSKWCICQ